MKIVKNKILEARMEVSELPFIRYKFSEAPEKPVQVDEVNCPKRRWRTRRRLMKRRAGEEWRICRTRE